MSKKNRSVSIGIKSEMQDSRMPVSAAYVFHPKDKYALADSMRTIGDLFGGADDPDLESFVVIIGVRRKVTT